MAKRDFPGKQMLVATRGKNTTNGLATGRALTGGVPLVPSSIPGEYSWSEDQLEPVGGKPLAAVTLLFFSFFFFVFF